MGDPIGIVSYPSAFTFFGDHAVTLPVDRPGAVLHFYGNNSYCMPFEAQIGMIHHFAADMHPLADTQPLSMVPGLLIEGNYVFNYLRLLVDGVNRLVKFLCDPAQFLDPTTSAVDLLRQAQAFSSVNMLFADLHTICRSYDNHARIAMANSALDKLANLRAELGVARGDERQIARDLPCFEQFRWLTGKINALGTTVPEVRHLLVGVARDFASVQTDMRPYGPDERTRLQRLRSFRNTTHGTFLWNGQFENLFLENQGYMPSRFPSIAWLLTFALLLDPRGFLDLRPTSRVGKL